LQAADHGNQQDVGIVAVTDNVEALNKLNSAVTRKVLVMRWLVYVCRFGLAALFLFTAGTKLAIVKAFAGNISELLSASGLNYQRWAWPPTTIAVIAAEVLTAILLLLPRTVRLGALLAAALLVGFAVYALYYVVALHGEPLECGCFWRNHRQPVGREDRAAQSGLARPLSNRAARP
jgi:hypothetical protein